MINYNNPKLHLAVISFALYILFALVSGQLALLALIGTGLLFAYSLLAQHEHFRAMLPSFLAQNFDLMVPTLAGLFWGISLWLTNEPQPILFTIITISLIAAALISFQDEFESTSGFVITPLLSLCIYLLVVPPSSLILISLGLLITTGLLFAMVHLKHLLPANEDNSKKTDQLPDAISTQLEEKEKYLGKIRDLSENIKQLEVDLSAAEMAKMEFLATMSHEIRTPLNGIVPLIDIVLDSELTDFQKDYLTTAHTSATQMQKLIDDLLDFSKVEAGKMRIELSGLKVKKILEEVRFGLEAAAEKKGLDVHINVDSSISPLLRGDPIRLRQVLTNLVSNAIKFSHNGTIVMSAVRLRSEGKHDIVRFSVQDEGIGIDSESIDELFNAFHQGDNSSTRKFGGTGLGLAISKKIVELLKGVIGVDSEKGKGSTFWFELPLLKSAGDTPAVEEESSDGYRAILINSNPELFKTFQKKLAEGQIKSHLTLNLQQTVARLKASNNLSGDKKKNIIFIDFDTNAKLFRQLLLMMQQKQLPNALVCVISKQSQIAGVKQQDNIHIISKDVSVDQLMGLLEPAESEAEKPAELLVKTHTPEEETLLEPKPANDRDVDSIDDSVLLVEDNEVNLKVAQKLIDYIGYPFDVARNGMEGLEKAKTTSYRMILMDCQMPVMDGYTCTRRIRNYEKDNHIGRTPIIAMTANAMLGDREKCIAAGMDDYMSKPLNRYILEKTLKKWDPLADVQKSVSVQPSIAVATSSPAKDSKPAETINSKWLSVESLEKIEEFMGDETNSLLELFKQESPALLKKMQHKQSQNDFPEVQKIAHTLKSTSANIGANGLSFFCKKMEQAAMEKNVAQMSDLQEKIKKSYLLTIREIRKYRQEA
ncbi:ATP-binding protein [Marinicella sp. W31]|uniref:hybrid sensor histidine kinase/response regulator n=1 Tax=Marinicella sp. W31 TaxID=3023713 RepID=UPI003756E1CB